MNDINYYWLLKEDSDILTNERFQRQKLYFLSKILK